MSVSADPPLAAVLTGVVGLAVGVDTFPEMVTPSMLDDAEEAVLDELVELEESEVAVNKVLEAVVVPETEAGSTTSITPETVPKAVEIVSVDAAVRLGSVDVIV